MSLQVDSLIREIPHKRARSIRLAALYEAPAVHRALSRRAHAHRVNSARSVCCLRIELCRQAPPVDEIITAVESCIGPLSELAFVRPATAHDPQTLLALTQPIDPGAACASLKEMAFVRMFSITSGVSPRFG